MTRTSKLVLALFATLAVVLVTATPAAAACPAFICYVDLVQGGSICPGAPYQVLSLDPVPAGGEFQGCPAGGHTAVVRVDVPNGCSGVGITVELGDTVAGHTVNVGDSATNDGFGGDAPGTVPAAQNAEVHVFDEVLRVYNAADNPNDVEELATAHLRLTDGALKLVVEDQFVSWGQPFAALNTPDLERLFFLENNPDNRTIYVGLNRVVASAGRNGCGVRHALMFTQ